MSAWTTQESTELYGIDHWGKGYFRANAAGHLEVTPDGAEATDGPAIDLKELVDTLRLRGIALPVLIRFDAILRRRVREIATSFAEAIREHGYKGRYRGVYPVKVNQQRQVVQTLVDEGRKHGMGLEVGSKPELLAVIPILDDQQALLICNGYKDVAYIEIALLATRLGRNPILVVEKFSELLLILDVAQRIGIRPRIGVRAKLAARGAGKWEASGGDRSKFGLGASEIVDLVEELRRRDKLDCLELLHFHLGSQITQITSFKRALKEATRLYVELHRMGVPLRILDVGGGLGVDYDGSRTSFESSMNYTLQEYANDIIWMTLQACDENDVPHPDIVTESGRALVAHHAVLVVNVLGVGTMGTPHGRRSATGDDVVDEEGDSEPVQELIEIASGISPKNVQEAFHDLTQLREEILTRFNVGLIDLRGRARAEEIYWSACHRILKHMRELAYVPEELVDLEKILRDTYFCNFSVFQSLPDHWAIQHLFPVVPIHRLEEKPVRRGVLADITCDSDGKMERFVDLRDVKHYLDLHETNGEDYLLGIFFVGAYQEILGDLHNLFGDTNAVHVDVDARGRYRVHHLVEGDRVDEVLGYVQFDCSELKQRMRSAAEEALDEDRITPEEWGRLLRRYEEGLSGYTYLES